MLHTNIVSNAANLNLIPPVPAEQFLTALYAPDDLIMVRFVETWDDNGRQSQTKGTKYLTAGSLSRRATFDYLEAEAAANDANFFFGVCPRSTAPKVVKDEGGRRKYTFDHACQIRLVRTLWADLDDCSPDQARIRCADAGLPDPTVIVGSGHGTHLYWKLADPIEIPDAYAGGFQRVYRADRQRTDFYDEDGEQVQPRRLVSAAAERVQQINYAVAKLIGGDETQDLARLLRMPGSMNRKDVRNGRTPAPCILVECVPDRAYPLDEFPVGEAAKTTTATATTRTTADTPTTPAVALDVSQLPKWAQAKWAAHLADLDRAEVGERSEADQRLMTFAVARGLDKAAVWEAVRDRSKFAGRGEDYFETCWRNAHKWDGRLMAEAEQWADYDPPEWRTPAVPDSTEADVMDAPDLAEPAEPDLTADAPQPAKGDRRDFVDANEVLNYPDPEFLIEGIMEEKSFGLIYGQPGSYKTFFALDMAISLAHGMPFLGHFNVPKAVPTAYITPEGTAGIKKRLKGWMEGHDVDHINNVAINRHAFHLNDEEEVEAVIKKVIASRLKPGVLFIDTLARNFAGDENSTRDMSLFVNNVMEIASRLGLAVVVVHHSGKDTTKGARGSIALLGAVDLAIEMTKAEGEKIATVRCRKQKDSEEFPAFNVTATVTGPSLSLTYGGATKAVEDEATRQVTTAELRPVLAVIPTTGGAKVAEIVTASDKPDATVRRMLDLAVKHGYADKVEGRPIRYTRTAKGTAVATGNDPEKAPK